MSETYFSTENLKLYHDDCLEIMKEIPENTIDSIITDPPYGMKFMDKRWDYDIPSVKVFREILRVAKPGAILLCFGGTRTWHRIAVNIEDTGWEIRDTIMWIYGTGFPKSLDISKEIDKAAGVAAIKENRNFIGIELNEDYIKIAVERLKREIAHPNLPLTF